MRAKKIVCKICKKEFWDIYSTLRHDGKDICHDCSNWLQLISFRMDKTEVISGVAYEVLPVVNDNDINCTIITGMDTMHYILKKDGSLIRSNDIWKIGDVPYHFRERLPDTGWWINRSIYNRIRQVGKHKCRQTQCYDRYHCLHYDYKIEFDKGPYNYIPRDYIVGFENCRHFVNMNDIKDYDRYFDLDI